VVPITIFGTRDLMPSGDDFLFNDGKLNDEFSLAALAIGDSISTPIGIFMSSNLMYWCVQGPRHELLWGSQSHRKPCTNGAKKTVFSRATVSRARNQDQGLCRAPLRASCGMLLTKRSPGYRIRTCQKNKGRKWNRDMRNNNRRVLPLGSWLGVNC
jgi:hypothetical protein